MIALILLACAVALMQPHAPFAAAQGDNAGSLTGLRPEISGFLVDKQGEHIPSAVVEVFVDGGEEAVAETESGEDGSWVIELDQLPQHSVRISVTRHHFEPYDYTLSNTELEQLATDRSFGLHEIILEGRVSLGFWVAGLAFLLTIILIALERLQNALAALTGISIVFFSTYVLGAFNEAFYVLDLERALTYINWEVIFLVMGMMIVIAIIEGTGIFQWLAFMAYRTSRGRVSMLIVVLVVITSVASALLDNVTTMLLVAPISLQIALAMDISPMTLLIPEILASNVAGIATLIGTPTNIMIGAYAGIGFNDFLVNQMLGVVVALVVMTAAVLFLFRHELRRAGGSISEALYHKLEQNAEITNPRALKRSLVVFGGMLVFFAVGESIHLVPAVTALVGATVLLLVVEPDIDKMLLVVDWTTLVFFMALFMLVGATQEVGLLSILAGVMGDMIGQNLVLGIVVLVFGSGLLSFVVANVPLTAALMPVVRYLSSVVPGAGSLVLYYALSMGTSMGGNGFIISGEANLMTSGIANRAGYRISFMQFLKIGTPITLLTLLVGTGWLYLRFIVWGG